MAAHQLQLFESTKDIYYRVFRQLRPRTIPPEILIRYRAYASANCYIRWKDAQLHVHLADSLRLAPPQVVEAIAFILLCKIFRKQIPGDALEAYRRYMHSTETREKLEQIRRQRGKKRVLSAQGVHYNLGAMFDELNAQFFGGQLRCSRIGWSPGASSRILGHYDPTHNTIVISRFLDRPEAGEDLVRYVVYHEMLHIKHPIRYENDRRRIHPREFQEEERRYPGFAELKERLRELCHRRGGSKY